MKRNNGISNQHLGINGKSIKSQRSSEKVTESDTGVTYSDIGFSENFTDEICRERIWLKKIYFVSGQQYITVRVIDSSKDPANE